ncbi:SDR family oxidoreductase [Amycolatopsis pigmentata]|uniref:SDR family oxidoreductase n=1 Tax=Amycolatopsis pigmentata TaxID=450801 RepID=A0ABW5FP85_9PSEU
MTDQYSDEYRATLINRIPLARKGNTAEIAATRVWLVSPAGGYVCGQSIVCDGGFTIA